MRLRLFVPFLALSLSIATPLWPAEITRTIQAQIDAFLAGDMDTAFSFASPGIRQTFGTPERFAQMVQSGYPMVFRSAGVRFLDRRDHPGGGQVQRVMIADEVGRVHLLDYLMIEGPDGWQIAGVQILRGQAVGT
ncbi:MAG: DUF4864 domain-containing protein [Alkalilacustris sp.]